MSVTNVLYMPIVVKMFSPPDLVRDLIGFVDDRSITVLDTLINSPEFSSASIANINGVGVMEFERDIPFPQISHLVSEDGHNEMPVAACVCFLTALKGSVNTEHRRAFFEGGRTLLSTCPVIIDGRFQYVVIGQDQCDKKNSQRPFSIELLTPSKTFLHSLYRVLVAKFEV